MVEMRCPECGYVQNLSEERFLAISEDFVPCPHCRTRVPKEWQPSDQEGVPEEARHKILAFSGRIINGGEVSREMVNALESLARRYGVDEASSRALAMGYARLGDVKKAEEFFRQAGKGASEDPALLRCFLKMRLAEGNLSEAVKNGRTLLSASGVRLEDEDVAGFALALLGLGKTAEARAIMTSYPSLDPGDPLVKQVRRELNRSGRKGIRSLLAIWEPLARVVSGSLEKRPVSARRRTHRTGHGRSAGTEQTSRTDPHQKQAADQAGSGKVFGSPRGFKAVLEYWIYAPGDAAPSWESIRERLTGPLFSADRKDASLLLVETLMERKELTISHVTREKAQELFNYPPELIPRNSRGLSDDDRRILTSARLIFRVRLTLMTPSGLDYLAVMVAFAEAVRGLTGGIVQDAVSHTLWGTEQWRRRMSMGVVDNVIESHVHFEVFDEGGVVWIHSHGMQKFGLPDIEMDGVPGELAPAGLSTMIMFGESLLAMREKGTLDLGSPLQIKHTPLLAVMEAVPGDEEGHFPAGSLKIFPYIVDYDPRSPATLRHVLKMVMSSLPGRAESETSDAAQSTVASVEGPKRVEEHGLRERLLEAHKKAKAELSLFKRSFLKRAKAGASVHAIKVGFPLGGGTYEWMWVCLDAWEGGLLVGRLANTPVMRKDLHKGCRVRVREEEIFDWAIGGAELSLRGAYTEAEIQQPRP